MNGLNLLLAPPGRPPFDLQPAGDSIVVGRSTAADVPVDDQSMSRRHARFTLRDGAWWVEDLESRNGTNVNGRPCSQPTRLEAGDVVTLGETKVTVSSTAPAAAPVAQPANPPASTAPAQPAPSGSDRERGDSADAGRLRILNDVHRALATPITLADLLDLIMDRVFAALGPEEGVIVLQGADGSLRHAASRRLPGAKGELIASKRLVDEVIRKRTPALVVDALLDERFAEAQSMVASGVRSIAAAPIADADDCLGMIAVYSRLRVRRFTEADLDLLQSLASAAALRVRNVALMEEAAERRVLERELALAHQIQMAMLPRRFPECEGVEIAAALKPARSVGGDFYDVLQEGDRLWFIIGDVSGKGVSAALFMAVAKTLFRAVRHGDESAADTLARMNRELARENDRAMFVTAFAGWMDPGSGILHVCNAGHNRPLLLRADGRTEICAAAGGPALGVVEDVPYREETIALFPGDTLLMYTDGATDARSPDGEQFGEARWERTAQESARSGASAGQLVAHLFRSLRSFEATAAQEDDITLLALRRR